MCSAQGGGVQRERRVRIAEVRGSNPLRSICVGAVAKRTPFRISDLSAMPRPLPQPQLSRECHPVSLPSSRYTEGMESPSPTSPEATLRQQLASAWSDYRLHKRGTFPEFLTPEQILALEPHQLRQHAAYFNSMADLAEELRRVLAREWLSEAR